MGRLFFAAPLAIPGGARLVSASPQKRKNGEGKIARPGKTISVFGLSNFGYDSKTH